MYSLFLKAREKYTVKEIAEYLNIAVGAVNRWEKLQEVPSAYFTDLKKLCGEPVDYASLSYQAKDQYFTKQSVVEYCYNLVVNKLNELNIDIRDYIFVEPSAGNGAFLSVLPDDTIALDIEPQHDKVVQQDFLDWEPAPNQKYIVIGNPPFGLRGHQALRFILKALQFADFCCFILPPLFNSSGKGTPGKRVPGNLILSEPCDSTYTYPDGQDVEVQTIFQIWTRLPYTSILEQQEEPEYFSIYSVSDGGTPSSTRNKDKIGRCHFYLPSTVYGDERMKLYYDFEELPQRRGYGIILDNENKLANIQQVNWQEVGFKSTNGAINLRMSSIIKTLNHL